MTFSPRPAFSTSSGRPEPSHFSLLRACGGTRRSQLSAPVEPSAACGCCEAAQSNPARSCLPNRRRCFLFAISQQATTTSHAPFSLLAAITLRSALLLTAVLLQEPRVARSALAPRRRPRGACAGPSDCGDRNEPPGEGHAADDRARLRDEAAHAAQHRAERRAAGAKTNAAHRLRPSRVLLSPLCLVVIVGRLASSPSGALRRRCLLMPAISLGGLQR